MPLKRIVFITNPNAGGRNQQGIQDAVRLLQAHLPTRLMVTERPGHASDIARQEGADPETLVAICGGDGTIFEALNGLPPQGILGFLPGGTANVITREFGIPQSLREAAKVLLTGAEKLVDVGEVIWQKGAAQSVAGASDQPFSRKFLMVSGFGFDAHVAARVPGVPKKLLGQYAYHLFTTLQFFLYNPPTISAVVDGGEPLTGRFALIANMRRYGGHLFFAHNARYDDGLLDLVLFRTLSFRSVFVSALEALCRRGVPVTLAERCRGKEIRLSFSEPTAVQLDGEVLPPLQEALVKVHPASLRVMIP